MRTISLPGMRQQIPTRAPVNPSTFAERRRREIFGTLPLNGCLRECATFWGASTDEYSKMLNKSFGRWPTSTLIARHKSYLQSILYYTILFLLYSIVYSSCDILVCSVRRGTPIYTSCTESRCSHCEDFDLLFASFFFSIILDWRRTINYGEVTWRKPFFFSESNATVGRRTSGSPK